MPAISLTQRAIAETVADPWELGPLHPHLAHGAVHVWRADLPAVTDDLVQLLCTEERARTKRILGDRDRELWARSHGVLRALLGRYLQKDPRTLRFVTGARGKPALLDDPVGSPGASECMQRFSPLTFNLSHSGHLALYAFSRTGAVGVDVEVARRPLNEAAVAGRVFGPAEARRLARLDSAAREREFLRRWVRHEAELKCRGTGIGAKLGDTDAEPWIAELGLGARAAGAVATECTLRELRCWEWQT